MMTTMKKAAAGLLVAAFLALANPVRAQYDGSVLWLPPLETVSRAVWLSPGFHRVIVDMSVGGENGTDLEVTVHDQFGGVVTVHDERRYDASSVGVFLVARSGHVRVQVRNRGPHTYRVRIV